MLELTLFSNHIKIKRSETDIKFIPCGMFVISTDQLGENILFSDEMDTYGTVAIKVADVGILDTNEGPFTLDTILNQLVLWNSTNSNGSNSSGGSSSTFDSYTLILEEGIHELGSIILSIFGNETKCKVGKYKLKSLKSDILNDFVPFTITAHYDLYHNPSNINHIETIEYAGQNHPFILEIDVFEKVQLEIELIPNESEPLYEGTRFNNMVECHDTNNLTDLGAFTPNRSLLLNRKFYYIRSAYDFDIQKAYKKVIMSAASINVETLGTNIKSVQILNPVNILAATISGTNSCVVKGYVSQLAGYSINNNTNLKLYAKGDFTPDGSNEIDNNIDSYFEFLNNGVSITDSNIIGNNHGTTFVLLNKTPNYYDFGITADDCFLIKNLNKSNTLILPKSMKTANNGGMAMSVQTAINNGVNVIFL